jgi:hypothetical protein
LDAGLGEPVVKVLDNQSRNDSDTKGVEDCLKWWHCSIINIVGVFAGTLLWHVGMRMRDRQQRVKAERLQSLVAKEHDEYENRQR